MAEVRKRVSNLDEGEVIAYTNIYGDGQGLIYTPAEAIAVLAGIANRPIVIDVDTFVGSGSIGGFVVRPRPIGQAAAELALRVLNGEQADSIPVMVGDFKAPVFDWRQLRRWKVDERKFPSGSEIRFRVPTAWERYKVQIVLVSALVALQTMLIVGLIYERRRRWLAELKARHRMSELARANKVAAAGVLSASMAHEINQPLTAIVANGDAGLMWLEKDQPHIPEAKTALNEIIKEGQRISEIINTVRALFQRGEAQVSALNIAEMVRDALVLYDAQIRNNQINVANDITDDFPRARGDRVQVLQALSNMILNGIEALAEAPHRRLSLYAKHDSGHVSVCIADTGPGIENGDKAKIFDAFFTTKKQGMGLGLVISKSIAAAQGGELLVDSGKNGTVFTLVLPRWDFLPA